MCSIFFWQFSDLYLTFLEVQLSPVISDTTVSSVVITVPGIFRKNLSVGIGVFSRVVVVQLTICLATYMQL